MPSFMPGMADPASLKAMYNDPRLPPDQRLIIGRQLEAMGVGGEGSEMPIVGADDEIAGFDIGAAIGKGEAPFKNEQETPDFTGGGDGTIGLPPQFIEMVRRDMQGGEGELTREDKSLALARAGFGMAASQSPHLGVAIGEGGLQGLQGLERVRQQRAMERMKRDALMQQGMLRAEELDTRKAIADQQSLDRQDSVAQRAEAARLAAEQRERDSIRDAETRRIALESARERGDSAAEARYTTADRLRRDQYFRTGQWNPIDGDKEHNVTGPPETDEYEGPLVDSPSLSFKAKEKLKLEQPKAIQAAETAFNSLDRLQSAAKDLQSHRGFEWAVGTGGTTTSYIPGVQQLTGAGDFRVAMKSMKTGVFTNMLQAMRDASKTGGALGNVSNVEVEKMEGLLGALEQSQTEDQMRTNLQKVVDYAHEIGGIMRKGYIRTYGDKEAPVLPWEKKDGAATDVGGTNDALSRAEKALKDAGM